MTGATASSPTARSSVIAALHGKHLIQCGQLKDPGHLAARADERQQAAFGTELAVRPHDLMERGGIDEREPGDVHQEQAGLLRGLRTENFRQCPGGDVSFPGEPHHDAGPFAVFHADRQFGHSGNYVTRAGKDGEVTGIGLGRGRSSVPTASRTWQ